MKINSIIQYVKKSELSDPGYILLLAPPVTMAVALAVRLSMVI